jgi:hypothetical protein
LVGYRFVLEKKELGSMRPQPLFPSRSGSATLIPLVL